MAYSQEKRSAVRNSYVNEQLDLKTVCKLHSVSYQTGRSWKKKAKDEGDDWDTARNALLLAQGGPKDLQNNVVQRFFIMSENLMKKVEDNPGMEPLEALQIITGWSDSVSKVSKSLGIGNDFDRIGFSIELLQLMASFIQKQFPQHVQAFLEVLDPFGEEVSKVYG